MSKEHLLGLLAQNELEELFRRLRESAQKELVLLESQWHDLKADVRAGVLTQEQANVEEARIRQRLYDFIQFGDKGAGARSAQPAASGQTGRRMLLGLGLLGALLVLFFLLKPLFSSSDEVVPELATSTENTPQDEPQKASFSKKLTIPTEPLELSADYVGTTGFQFVEAVLSNKNPENYQLAVRMRCIRPPYGENISSHTLHLLHGETEIAPYQVDFPFVEAKTTGEGTIRFEVPKSWKDARLVLYYGTGYEKKTEVPIRF